MHIPDGFVSVPVNAATFLVSASACAVAASRAGRSLGERQVPLLGVTAAFVFAAQMLNFPVAGGTSGHFLGAMLAAVLLGPAQGYLAMAVVLIIQCLMFSDGGITALGSNLLNMGLVGGVGAYAVFRVALAAFPKTRSGFLAAAGTAAWASVVLASAACAFELAASGTCPFEIAMPAMVGVHAVIGVGEAVITAAVLSTVLSVRPDLVAEWRGVAAGSAAGEARA